nr:hypothetical protein [Tanacetum cinerariifolium]
MTDAQQEKENLEITQEQVVEDAHVTITKKTEVHVTSSSRSSDLASKFLNFLDVPPADTEMISPLDVHVHYEVPRIHTSTLLAIPVSVIPKTSPVYMNIPQSSQTFTSPPLQVIALEKDVAELKNDSLHTKVTALVDDHLNTWMGATREEFMNFLLAPLIDRITKQRSRDDKDKDEGPFDGSDQGLKKRKTSKDAEPTTSPKTKDSSSKSSRGTKSQQKSSRKSVHVEEPEFEALSEKLDWENPEGGDYPFDLSKHLPLITRGNRQSVPVEFFINNDLKYLQG